ncbi:hypothetical protein RDI58_026770 [Solanum bulbocastanum]|uniref:Uncharacterized protein n=1 Tax=Solanum bulbocastanum TaxID=147425 RepID=A0AAN8SUI7_SOLBU
MRFLENQLP